jgi:hypothetical protein
MFAPDDFGLNNGSILRERLLICGLVIFVPLFRVQNSTRLKRFAQACLLLVVIFQTSALWEYSLQTKSEAKEIISARSAVTRNSEAASIVLVEDSLRFNSTPLAMMNNYLGIEQHLLIWDNYEIGHYLFPVVAKNGVDKQFVFDLTRFNAFSLNNPAQNFEEKLANLDACLTANHQKIKTLIIWGNDAQVNETAAKWFEPEAFFENGRVRVFRHKP